MKRRSAVKIISFCLAAVMVCVGLLIKEKNIGRRYRLEIENTYSRSLDDLTTAVNNISLTLNKARFVTTPEQISQMAATLLSEAETSKTALAQLPQNGEIPTLNRFLSQVGNYAQSVSRSLISTGKISEKDSENIEALCSAAAKIAELVSSSQINYNNAEYWASEIEGTLDSSVDLSIAESFNDLEESLTDFPTLIYDGPYSDHILEKEPEMIKNAGEISEKEALEIALGYTEGKKGSLKFDSSTAGNIPTYRFVGKGITLEVSKNGGHTVYMRRERDITSSLITSTQAVEKAKRYLSLVKMDGFIDTYFAINEGICVVNFAFVDGETVCYTDLIKVGVAMDNGEIMLYEAAGYLSNHKTRSFETPVFEESRAEEMISEKLKIESRSVALIPTNGGGEARCYQFSCVSGDGQDILVFINALTLKEEQILILLKSDGGTLVK